MEDGTQPQGTENSFGKSLKKPKKKSWKEAGQVSIFLGMSLLTITGFIAFVVNVGLFVKAKINLQNSVDAAAFAGAAVQARQLTNMGHLNFEMRNNYKEWLLKYYVFGNIGLDSVETPDATGNAPTCGTSPEGPLNNGAMNFRLRQFKGSTCQYYDADLYDRFNVPSICIHFGSNNNICEIVTLPGLPRFNTVGLPSISEQHESFLNNIVETKSDDCADRSNVNMGAAMLWTYGTEKDVFPNVPAIASSRVGAWVNSIELAMRMRNLEAIMNFPPQSDFACLDPGAAGEPCTPFQDITARAENTALNYLERFVKAYDSGYRNLSGGANKEAGDGLDFAASFRLREIPPTPLSAQPSSLSGFLIPPTATDAFQKYYVDLKVMPVNYAIFYTSFFPVSGSFKATDPSAPPAEGKCGGTKTAIPVPGYIMGFIKSPEVVTYYAVEGKANFTGLFYPFTDGDGIVLKTYAAAKPFGGRIGPAIFNPGIGGSSDTQVTIRTGTQKTYSANYLSAFNTASLPFSATPTDDEIVESVTGGYPVPTTQEFWIQDNPNAVVGGNPTTTSDIGFGIPNLIYDFNSYNQINSVGFAGTNINPLNAASSDAQAYGSQSSLQDYGLYNIDQFKMFVANKVTGPGAVFSNEEIMRSIINVRRPTRYEALNFLLPTMSENGSNGLGIDNNGYVHPLPATAGNPISIADPNARLYRIYAPLFGLDPVLLYPNPAAITGVIDDYINSNQKYIDLYLESLDRIAGAMRRVDSTTGSSIKPYASAAASIHPDGAPGSDVTDASDCDTISMASKFFFFFQTSPNPCFDNLSRNTTVYFNEKASTAPGFQFFHTGIWKAPTWASGNADPAIVEGLTGYKPGPRQGADDRGNMGSPFIAKSFLAKRGFYSTKFVSINALLSDSSDMGSGGGLPVFAEGNGGQSYTGSSIFATGDAIMRNTISSGELSAYGNNPSF